jgi:hypothetical protein
MRSFIASAVLIALVLIGQQWVVKSSEAQSRPFTPISASE